MLTKQKNGALQVLSPVPESITITSSKLFSIQKNVSALFKKKVDASGGSTHDKCVVLFSGGGGVERVLKQVLPYIDVLSL